MGCDRWLYLMDTHGAVDRAEEAMTMPLTAVSRRERWLGWILASLRAIWSGKLLKDRIRT